MKNIQDRVFDRLLKKLSALRATLKGDERDLLDGLVVSSTEDVGAHSMRVIPISPARSNAKSVAPDEAHANAMKVSTAKSVAKSKAPDEAHANAMKVSTAKSVAKSVAPDEAHANAMKISTARIVFDPNKDEYQLT